MASALRLPNDILPHYTPALTRNGTSATACGPPLVRLEYNNIRIGIAGKLVGIATAETWTSRDPRLSSVASSAADPGTKTAVIELKSTADPSCQLTRVPAQFTKPRAMWLGLGAGKGGGQLKEDAVRPPQMLHAFRWARIAWLDRCPGLISTC